MSIVKPMLAAPCDNIAELKIVPGFSVTPKIDGIRCIIKDGVALARSLKPIPNKFIQSILAVPELEGLDGELTVGESFQACTSGIMTRAGKPDFHYHVFDRWDQPNVAYLQRIQSIVIPKNLSERVSVLSVLQVRNLDDVQYALKNYLSAGYEGAMLRRNDAPYSYKRVTLKSMDLIKIKPFEDAEATVVGWEERMHNANEATTNELGYTKRSSHKENLVPMDTLGSLVVENEKLWPGRTFNIGTGFTDKERDQLWAQAKKGKLKGRIVKFKYQAIGVKDVPRIPSFVGFRDSRDT